jgi:hypothetical protein
MEDATSKFDLPRTDASHVQEIWGSTGDRSYSVDLYQQTCTCPDFQAQRVQVSVGGIGRACKHLGMAIRSHRGLAAELDPLTTCILTSGTKLQYLHTTMSAGGDLYVGVSPDSEWADVLFRKYRQGDALGAPTGTWAAYGFHLVDWRWSYGDGPRGAREIRQILAPLRRTVVPRGARESQEGSTGCLVLLAGGGLLLAMVRSFL